MAINSKDAAVLQDALLACGLTVTVNQLVGITDINQMMSMGAVKFPNLFFNTAIERLQSRLISDRRRMEEIQAEAIQAHADWRRYHPEGPRFFEPSFVNTPADLTGSRISEMQLQRATGADLDRIGALYGGSRHQGVFGFQDPEDDDAFRRRLERAAGLSTYNHEEEPGMRLHHRAPGWHDAVCSDCAERFTGETHSCQ